MHYYFRIVFCQKLVGNRNVKIEQFVSTLDVPEEPKFTYLNMLIKNRQCKSSQGEQVSLLHNN